jgi:Tfp pilus assembly protein PilE
MSHYLQLKTSRKLNFSNLKVNIRYCPTSPLIRNQRGVALLYLIILFTLLGVLVSAGVRQFGSTVNLTKVTDTKTELERDVQMITAWAVRNGRLPTAAADVFNAVQPLDAWGKSIVYVKDINLTASASGGLCGRRAETGEEVAFLLISGGEDMSVTSTSTITDGVLGSPPAAADMHRSVSLKELKAKAGCDSSTQGNLKILNNELPTACAGSATYSATLYAGGGVSAAYAWSLPTPWNLQIDSTTGILSPTSRITTTPGTYSVSAKISDTFSEIRRTYPVNVTISGSCAAGCQSDAPGCPSLCHDDPACKAECANDPETDPAKKCATLCPDCVLP